MKPPSACECEVSIWQCAAGNIPGRHRVLSLEVTAAAHSVAPPIPQSMDAAIAATSTLVSREHIHYTTDMLFQQLGLLLVPR
jgi:hypothetical protein